MRYHEYVGECFRRAFSGKIKTAELWAGILALVFTAITYFWRPLGEIMSWIPAAAFGVIFIFLMIFGLALAPFRIHQEQEEVCRRLQDELDVRKRRRCVVDKLAKLHQEFLQLLMRKVESNDGYISWKQEIEDWYKRAQNEIAGSLGNYELVLFLSISPPASALFVQPFNQEHLQDLQFFGARYQKLEIIIGDLSARLR